MSSTWCSGNTDLPDDSRIDPDIFPISCLKTSSPFRAAILATLQPEWMASELAAAIILAGQSQHLSISFATSPDFFIVQIGLAPLQVLQEVASWS